MTITGIHSRRAILSWTAILPSLTIASGCATTQVSGPQIASLLSAAATSLVAVVGGLAGVSPATLKRYQKDAVEVATLASDLIAASSAASNATALEAAGERFVNDLSASSGLLPTGARTALMAFAAALPMLLAAYNVLAPLAAPAPTVLTVHRAAVSFADPLGILRDFVHGRL